MNFNHINKKLTERRSSELKDLYQTYKQYWCYKKMHKKY